MRHSKIFKREDGSRVEVTVKLEVDTWKIWWGEEIAICALGKRSFLRPYSTEDYRYRGLSMEDRRKFEYDEIRKYVSDEEIHSVKLELWETIKPVSLLTPQTGE